jgi:hypothetical protein
MKALVVYESMFGNTRKVAEQIGEGLRPEFDVTVVPVTAATPQLVGEADLLVAGGPTHVHGLPGVRSRNAAKATTEKEGSDLALEPGALEPGIREWLKVLTLRPATIVATFDTRMHGPALFTGRASRGIARRLRRRGAHVVATESFFVDKQNRLSEGEVDRARTWARAIGSRPLDRGAPVRAG